MSLLGVGGPGACYHTLVPCVLVTRVLPQLRTLNIVGALMSYQSFLAKGSVLLQEEGP